MQKPLEKELKERGKKASDPNCSQFQDALALGWPCSCSNPQPRQFGVEQSSMEWSSMGGAQVRVLRPGPGPSLYGDHAWPDGKLHLGSVSIETCPQAQIQYLHRGSCHCPHAEPWSWGLPLLSGHPCVRCWLTRDGGAPAPPASPGPSSVLTTASAAPCLAAHGLHEDWPQPQMQSPARLCVVSMESTPGPRHNALTRAPAAPMPLCSAPHQASRAGDCHCCTGIPG